MTKQQIAEELIQLLNADQLRKAAIAGIKAHFRGERGEHRISDDLHRLLDGNGKTERDFNAEIILRSFT